MNDPNEHSTDLDFRRLAEQVSEGVLVAVDERNYWMNEAFAGIFGYHTAELIGQGLDAVIAPEELPRTLEYLRDRSAGNPALGSRQVSARHKSGERVIIEISANVFRVSGCDALLISARDVTARIVMDNDLRASEMKYRELADLLPEIIFESGLDGTIKYVNQTGLRLTGYSLEDIHRHISFFNLLAPGEHERAARNIVRRINGDLAMNEEYTVVRKDGSTFPISIHSTPIIRDGKPIGLRGIAVDITEQKRIDRALRESEEQYRVMIENANEGIDIIREGKNEFFNDKILEFTGYTREEFAELPFFDIIHPDDRATVIERHRCRLAGEDEARPYQVRYRDRYGNGKWMEINAVRVEWKGRPAALALINDITERRKIQDELRESEERFRQLSYAAFESIFFHIHGIIVEANNSFSEMFGYPHDEILGKSVFDITASESWDAIREGMATSTERPYEAIGLRKDGSTFHAEVRGRLTSYRNQPARVVAVRDIGARKKSDEALRLSERRYRLVAENVTDLIWTMNMRLRLTFVSPSVERLLGYRVNEIHEIPLRSILTLESYRTIKRLIRQYAQDHQVLHEPATLELEHVRKDGSRIWAEVILTAIIGEGGEPFSILGVTRDLSERKRAEAERERMHAQIIQAQKMEAVGTLAGGVAHDFNNLLTAIIGTTDLILMDVDPDDSLYKNLKLIEQTAKRAADLTRQLLLFSRKQPMRHQPLNLNRTIDNLLKIVKRVIGENIEVRAELANDLAAISGDEANIEQVLMNLAVNAHDAMPDGGVLTITTATVAMDETAAREITGARPGTFACLSVADTGAGISPENLSRIFEPFFSTKDARRGTGLGLSVVYGIVNDHGGFISVESRLRLGTRFSIYLPVISTADSDAPQEPIYLRRLVGDGQRILLVEDQEEVRNFAAKALGKCGYSVFAAATSREALDVFERERGAFDLVFSDVVLPDMSGLDLIEEILRRKAGVPLLLASGYTDAKSQWSIISERGYPFIQKPYTLQELLRVIRELLRGER